MKGCSMERKSIGCDIRSLPGCARTRILEAWSRSKPASLEYLTASPNPSGTLSVLARAVSGPFCDRSVRCQRGSPACYRSIMFQRFPIAQVNLGDDQSPGEVFLRLIYPQHYSRLWEFRGIHRILCQSREISKRGGPFETRQGIRRILRRIW